MPEQAPVKQNTADVAANNKQKGKTHADNRPTIRSKLEPLKTEQKNSNEGEPTGRGQQKKTSLGVTKARSQQPRLVRSKRLQGN
jgi:hypothetical protein